MTQFFNAPDGTRIAYEDEGDGLPVLCLAGLTRSMDDFDLLAPTLSDCRMIRMDYRGRGQSDWTGAGTYTVPHEAADALALLDHLGVDRAALVGTSRGGLISMFLAATARDRLRGVCLNDVGPALQISGLNAIMEYVGRAPSARTLAEVAERLPQTLKGFANVPPERWQAEAARLFRQTDEGVALTYDPTLRDSFLESMKTPDATVWPLFDALQGMPVALIHGAGSDLLGDETVAEMRERRPDMIYARVPDRGHIPWLDEPEAVAAIRSWLDAVRSA
ncbi:alpha/beta hydrolase [uncultured Paracoccus sp.]|uniref:alpha/beta fold hydrolase n=1 Tax=uncultured Paracoccus sp. TaxID=189685 RepID=UPI00261BF704|nr:alpha/beta hydrolase [uncultured Paracoccus sp.]